MIIMSYLDICIDFILCFKLAWLSYPNMVSRKIIFLNFLTFKADWFSINWLENTQNHTLSLRLYIWRYVSLQNDFKYIHTVFVQGRTSATFTFSQKCSFLLNSILSFDINITIINISLYLASIKNLCVISF